ncbi:MAG: FemAB family PEP-CTERM system-associated protein [Phycisphaerales bacterium]|nr:FemAB family PEP-CTERM system-associated protein [Phycisphaerales bacterium]
MTALSTVPRLQPAIASVPAGAPARGESSAVVVRIVSSVDDGARTAWRDFCGSAPDATVFHRPEWFDAVARAFGHDTHLLLAESTIAGSPGRRELVGLLPLTDVRSRLTGRRLISAAYGTSGGVVARDAAAARRLVESAENLALRLGASLVEIRSQADYAPDWQVDRRYVEFVRDLPAGLAAVDAWLPRKARAAARQAREREGLTVRHAAADLDLVWDLYSRSMRRLGSINYPRSFFHELARTLGPRLWTTTVWRGPRPVAGVVSISDRETIRPYFSGLDEHLRCTGCANYLYLAVVERAVAERHTRFDFGRTRRDNVGAFEFKKNQGFAPRPVEYRRFVAPGRKPVDVSPSNPRFSLARRIWPHMPLALTRPLGAWLSRSIPG